MTTSLSQAMGSLSISSSGAARNQLESKEASAHCEARQETESTLKVKLSLSEPLKEQKKYQDLSVEQRDALKSYMECFDFWRAMVKDGQLPMHSTDWICHLVTCGTHVHERKDHAEAPGTLVRDTCDGQIYVENWQDPDDLGVMLSRTVAALQRHLGCFATIVVKTKKAKDFFFDNLLLDNSIHIRTSSHLLILSPVLPRALFTVVQVIAEGDEWNFSPRAIYRETRSA